MIEWYKKVVFENYANFSGRARRSEHWYFYLGSMIISILLGIIDGVFGYKIENLNLGIIGLLYSLLILIPSLAVSVRRLHDVGKSGWFLLVILTCIGVFWILYLFCIDGDQGTNEYGPNPKANANEIDEIGKTDI
jgi:uncharacterized membrane protein YhaH (DUF805 family)